MQDSAYFTHHPISAGQGSAHAVTAGDVAGGAAHGVTARIVSAELELLAS